MADQLDVKVASAHDRYRGKRPLSAHEHELASKVLPGGNTRSVLHFEPYPFRVERAAGATLVDIDGLEYIDFCGNHSAGLFGHSPESISTAIREVLEDGWTMGATHQRERLLAQRLCDRFASLESVRFTNSGTEANLMAIGTAMHHTSRTGVGVFDHGYHGGVLSFGPLGGPHNKLNTPHRFIVAPFDDIDGLDALFADEDLACVLVETVQGSGGCRPASTEFLAELRRRCDATGTVLIFDEVMTSRLSPGGAQERVGILPDMTTLGKYLAGGMTFGAFGGRSEIMQAFDPAHDGQLTQAGTFNNNVVSMAAAIAALDHELSDEAVIALNDRGDALRHRLVDTFSTAGVPLWVTGLGSMLCIHSSDARLIELFFHDALDEGLYLARRGFMALSMAITDDHVEMLGGFASDWSGRVVISS